MSDVDKRKIFVIDTNVLIHNPKALFEFKNNIVVLPIKVIEELDKFKSSSDIKGLSARTAIRELDDLRKKGSLSEGVEIPKQNGIIKIVIDYIPKDHYKNDNESEKEKKYFDVMDTNIADNEILLTALKLKLESKEEVIFVSKDLNSRIKANAIGIKTKDFEKQKVNDIEELYTGYAEIKTDTEKISNLDKPYKIDELLTYTEIEKKNIVYNTYITLVDVLNPKHTRLAKYNKENESIEPIPKIKEDIWGIRPLNREQHFAFNALLDDSISLVTLIGQAGTGKTLIALACGMKRALDDKIYSKVVVSRPIVPMGKDIGFLPGSKNEKLHYWMQPIFDNLRFILNKDGNKEDYDSHKHKRSGKTKDGRQMPADDEINHLMEIGQLELEALTYIRGRSLPNLYLIIDEAQNLTPHEVKTIISRAGTGTKVVLTGDPYQIDNPYLDSNSNGLIYTIDRFKGNKIFSHIKFIKSERSELASLAADLL